MTELMTAEEARVVGALAEKELTTPQYYPLTLNALVNACNQSNNRDPVVAYSTEQVEDTITALREKRLARIVHPGGGSRVAKYRHVLDELLGLDRRELALITVLLLRGAQTLNELRTRTERMADFDDAASVERDLDRLAARDEPLVARVGRLSGQREERFATTLTAMAEAPAAPSGAPAKPSRGSRPTLLGSPRLAPLADGELSDDQRELLQSTGAGLDANNLFATLARHPGLFRRWLPFGGKLLRGGKLSHRHRELIILRTAHLTGAAYEWGHHVEIAKSEAGLTDDDIERVVAGPDADWSGADRLVLVAADEVHGAGIVSQTTWDGLRGEGFDEAQLIEVPMVAGHYRMLVGVIASLGIQPEDGLDPLRPLA